MGEHKDSTYTNIIAVLNNQGGDLTAMTTADIARSVNISTYSARYHLLQLRQKGYVLRTEIQRGKSTLWRLIKPV